MVDGKAVGDEFKEFNRCPSTFKTLPTSNPNNQHILRELTRTGNSLLKFPSHLSSSSSVSFISALVFPTLESHLSCFRALKRFLACNSSTY